MTPYHSHWFSNGRGSHYRGRALHVTKSGISLPNPLSLFKGLRLFRLSIGHAQNYVSLSYSSLLSISPAAFQTWRRPSMVGQILRLPQNLIVSSMSRSTLMESDTTVSQKGRGTSILNLKTSKRPRHAHLNI